METIKESNIVKEYHDDMVTYAIEVNRRRQVPDYRDGLKLVVRRILHTMFFDETRCRKATVKSAKVVGTTMGKYHPHGDCLQHDTKVYSLDGNVYTIGELYKKGVKELEILAVDNLGNVVPAIAHSFRIGQYTDRIYHIKLSNGADIQVTGNHPFLTANNGWVKAEDLIPGVRLYSRYMDYNNNGRPKIDEKLIQDIVYNYYYGPVPKGYQKHHLDGNKLNNTKNNFGCLTHHDHAVAHAHETRTFNVLGAGRVSMADPNHPAHTRNKRKNSILCQQINKDRGLRIFKYAIRLLEERNLPITEESYETLRGEVYNLSKVDRLCLKYGVDSFDDLVKYELPSISELYEQNKVNYEQVVTIERKVNMDGIKKHFIFELMDALYDQQALDIDAFAYFSAEYEYIDPSEFYYYLHLYSQERPFIISVDIEEVNKEPMYDFTVDGFENMLIPVGDAYHNSPLICIHNSSIYNAMKPIANDFECQVPLIDTQGNFGNFQGDGQSAARYTEVKLSQFAKEYVIGELVDTENVINWLTNYDGTEKEPEYLPVKVPLLLINGSYGLGVGLMTEIPKHNLAEVIDATIQLIHNPDSEIILIPDHCMPCEIIDTDFKKISRLGSGKYRVRGIANIIEYDQKPYKGYPAIEIVSTPDRVYLYSITDKIEEMVSKGKLPQVKKLLEDSTETEMREIIILNKGSDPNYVRDILYKHTSLEDTYTVNFEVIDGIEPVRSNYKDYLLSFIENRKICKFRKYSILYQDVMTKYHEKQAYVDILSNHKISEVMKEIEKQTTIDDARDIEYLVSKLGITDLQARFILNAGNKTRSKAYLEKFKEEAAELKVLADDYFKRITHDELLIQEIEQELLECKKKYGRPRMCKVISANDANTIPAGDFKIVITENNYIRKIVPNDPLKCSRAGSEGAPKIVLNVENRENILLFDENGKVFKYPIHKIPLCDKTSMGVDVRIIIKGLTSNICKVMYEPMLTEIMNKKLKHFLVIVSELNRIKKIEIEDIIQAPPSGILYTKLNDGDRVKDISIIPQTFDVVIYTRRKALRIDNSEISHLKRNTLGTLAMNTKDPIEGLSVVFPNTTDIIVVTKSGKVNRFDALGFAKGSRNQAGSSVIKLSKTDSIFAVLGCNEKDSIKITTDKDTITIPVQDITKGSSASAGTSIIKGNVIRTRVISNK